MAYVLNVRRLTRMHSKQPKKVRFFVYDRWIYDDNAAVHLDEGSIFRLYCTFFMCRFSLIDINTTSNIFARGYDCLSDFQFIIKHLPVTSATFAGNECTSKLGQCHGALIRNKTCP